MHGAAGPGPFQFAGKGFAQQAEGGLHFGIAVVLTPGQAQALAAVPPLVGRDGELVAGPLACIVLSGPFVLPGPAVFLPGFRRFGDERGDAQRRRGKLAFEVFQGDGIGQDRAQVAALFSIFQVIRIQAP